ncbi:MAG: acyltransferase [Phascolarctobacterium sp.]|nr:acyltransferase [Phascolarctobacterium sp.]
MRNTIIDNIRGLCMLGVVGIHIGSLALAPNNFTLYCFLEVLSRYSVPAFFFISGYGLACTDKTLLTGGSLSYLDFLKKRLKGAGLPYLSWSLFYLLYFTLVLPKGMISWSPLHVAFVLFFGLGCYHLYFMVILLWFYASYPLWRALLRSLLQHGVTLGLGLLFVLQLAMNWWTTHPGVDSSSWSLLAKNFFNYRLNYLPLHYLLIFMLGCVAAVNWEKFIAAVRKHALAVIIFYIASILYIVGSAYYAYTYEKYSLLDLANTYHQLSPQGLVYTVASIFAFCLGLDWLERKHKDSLALKGITVLSSYSMLIYFLHPLLLEWMTSLYTKFGIVMTVKKVTFSYFALVLGTLAVSVVLTKVFKKNKMLSLLFTGKGK